MDIMMMEVIAHNVTYKNVQHVKIPLMNVYYVQILLEVEMLVIV